MYEYPSGLKCNASKKRVEMYERFVPSIILFLSFFGYALTIVLLKTFTHVFDKEVLTGPEPILILAGLLLLWMTIAVISGFTVMSDSMTEISNTPSVDDAIDNSINETIITDGLIDSGSSGDTFGGSSDFVSGVSDSGSSSDSWSGSSDWGGSDGGGFDGGGF